MKQRYCTLLVLWLVTTGAPAQTGRRLQYSLEMGGLAASAEHTPFWLRSNQYGTVPVQGSFGTVRATLVRPYQKQPDSTRRKKARFDWGFGVYAVLNAGPAPTSYQSSVLLPDAYLKVRWGWLELYGGNRREVFGLGDTLLTSGFVAWSGNALPFPKIQLHTPNFVPLGFTKQVVALKAGYAHGWFSNTYVPGSYLHQKYVYGRIGKPTWRIRFYAGLNHQVQWAGQADYLIGTRLAVDGKLPSSFRDYVSLVTGHYPDALQNDRFTSFDGENRIGNHVGSYDFALESNGRQSNWLLYHLHMYDDASGLAFQNIPDGLTGLRWLNRRTTDARFRMQRVVVEWLTTTDQSGPTFDQTARYQGADNYFNHSQYIEGWSYRGRTIGTPFIAPRSDFTAAVNAFTGGGFFPNNRLVMWYSGLAGSFRRGPLLTTRLSYSRNFGTYNQPYPGPFHQFSILTSAQWPFRRWPRAMLTTTIALDRGDLFAATTGGFISLKKTW